MTSRRKTVILVSCCLSLLIVSMDATIVNVALPVVMKDLGLTGSDAQWLNAAYALVFAALTSHAQTSATEPDQEVVKLESFTVTGSNIKRLDQETTLPVTVLDP